MTRHLQREIEALKKNLLLLCGLVEESVFTAVRASQEANSTLAQEVIEGDRAIDLREIEIEEECLKILALHQPVAVDLRFIVVALKINNDMERIGDLAVNIADRALALALLKDPRLPVDLLSMTVNAQKMLKQALDALVNLDVRLASNVLLADKEIDRVHRAMHEYTYNQIKKNPADVEKSLLVLSVSRNLERIADLATNIAEDVIYMIEGDIVRHHAGKTNKLTEQ
jgi:phosphate transport system protein